MRIAAAVLFSIALVHEGGIVAQRGASAAREGADVAREQEAAEEVIVRGRRLTDLRFEVELAQERAYAIFNEINSDDDFDVYCREERKYHSRATQRTCRPQFENRISSTAAGEYLATLNWRCPAGTPTQECIFSDYSSDAISAARGIESQAPSKRKQMQDELVRLANQDDRFAQAILDWYETTQRYDEARKRRTERRARD